MVPFRICLVFIFPILSLTIERNSSNRSECNGHKNHFAADDEAFWHEQLRRVGWERNCGGSAAPMKELIRELSNKQQMLETMFGAVPKVHFHRSPMSAGRSMLTVAADEYKCLNNRRNSILTTDPALGQLLDELFVAEFSAKRNLQEGLSDVNAFSLLKKMRQRLAFVLLFLQKRHQIPLTAADGPGEPFVLTQQNLKHFFHELVTFTEKAPHPCTAQRENCENDGDGQRGAGGEEKGGRRKRLLHFISRSIQMDWNGLGSNDGLARRSKNTKRRHKRRPPSASELIMMGICLLFFLMFISITIILCNDAIIRVRTFFGHSTAAENAAIAELSLNQKCLAAFNGIPPIIVDGQKGSGDEDQLNCAICLGSIDPGVQVRPLPVCKHKFHDECIELWIQGEHNACPICRQEIFSREMLAATTLSQAAVEHGQQSNDANLADRNRQNDAIAIDINEGEEVIAERTDHEEQQQTTAASGHNPRADNGQA